MVPSDLLYTSEHEWVKVNGDVATVGITDHAQDALGDIVFVELPAIGKQVTRSAEVVALESTKAAASVYAPAAGNVTETNETLADNPAVVNEDCYGNGWMYKMKVSAPGDLSALMNAAKYEEFLKTLG